MPLYNAGNAYLQVVPSFKGIEALMKKELAKLGAQVDGALEKSVTEGFGKGAAEGAKAAKKEAEEAAEEAAGAFAEKLERRIKSAMKALGDEVVIGAKTKDFDKAYNKVIEQLKELSEKEIGPAFTAKQAAKELDQLGQQMRDLEKDAPNLDRLFNLRQARAEAESFLQDLRQNGATTGAELGRRMSGAFAEEMRKGTKAALDALPEFVIDANTTPAQQKVMDLRALLERLNVDIELGLDDRVAEQRLRTILEELERLDQYEADPSVAVNSAIALTKLAAVKKLLDALDNDDVDIDVDVDVDTDRAAGGLRDMAEQAGVTFTRLGYLIAVGGAIGTAIVPAAAAAAVAVSGIGFAALGAGAGLATLFFAFNGIADAAKALHSYNQDADKSAKSLSQSTNAIASATDAVKNAQDGLARAREAAAERQREASQRIVKATKDIEKAERNVAEAIRDVAVARRDGMRAVRDAVEDVQDADRDYTEALATQREAREALNEAYRQAVRDLADLNSAVRRNALDQRQAALDEIKAREELEKFLSNPRATEEEREQARITYERRILQIEDLKRQGEELAEQQQKANEQGIEGSEAVTRAQKNLKRANEGVESAARRQRDAQERLAREQESAAERVRDAQQGVADAQDRLAEAQGALVEEQREAAKAQRDSQRQIAQAQRSLAAANRQLAQSYTSAATSGGAALDTLNDKMADLSPAGRKFVYFLDQVMRPAMDRIQKAAQEGLFPGLTRGLTELISGGRLDAFADFIYDVADAMGDSFEYAVDQLNDPVWKEFFGYIGQTAGPVIRGATRVAFNFAKGLANIMNALTGFNSGMGNGLVSFSEAFVRWSQRLTESKGFQAFIEYVRQEGPHVVGLLKQFAIFAGRLVVAAAPIGAVVVRVFEALFELLNKIPIRDLTMLLGAIGALSIALLILAAGTAIATASIATLVTLGVAAVGAGLAVLYNHFDGFRRVVDTTFRIVGQVFMWLLHNVWIPFYTALWKGLVWLYKNVYVPYWTGMVNRVVSFGQHVQKLWPIVEPGFRKIGEIALWLWNNAIKPAFLAIGGAIQWVWFKILKPALAYWSADTETIAKQQAGIWPRVAAVLKVFAAVIGFLWKYVIVPAAKVIGAVLVFLWKFVVVPVFTGIVAAVRIAWAVLSVIFRVLIGAVRLVGAIFSWLWRNIIQPVWKYIVVAIRTGWAIIQVIIGAFRIALKILGLAFRLLYQIWIKPWVDRITALIRVAYLIGIKPWIDRLRRLMTILGEWWDSVLEDYIRPFWTGFVTAIRLAYQLHVKPWIDRIRNIWKDYIVPAWQRGIAAAAALWEVLRNGPKVIVRFIVQDVMNEGLLAGYNRVAKFFKVKPDDVKINLPKGFAVGGAIDGPGTSTSDSVLIRASRGEHMLTAAEVSALGGHEAVYAMRKAIMSGWRPPGYAIGGEIGGRRRRPGTGDNFGDWLLKKGKQLGKKATDAFSSTVDFLTDPVKSLKDLAAGLLAKMPNAGADMAKVLAGAGKGVLNLLVDKVKGLFLGGNEGVSGGLGAAAGGGLGGSAGMMRILRAAFPGLPLNSGFRPGAITATGNPSMHGLDRAVDVPPRMDVFEWIRAHFPMSRELIFSPAGGRQLYRGQNHMYSGITRSMHFDHVHWSYDQGGYLQPGYSMVYNGTSKPEPVLTSQQWNAITSNPTRGYDGPSEVHHWETAGTTITPAWLEANQRRRDTLARVNRRNR
jgi:hypothetical protein